MHKRFDDFLEDGFDIVAFRDLPRPHQLAFIWYMAVDAEAWNVRGFYKAFEDRLPEGFDAQISKKNRLVLRDVTLRIVNDFFPQFVSKYGDTKVGLFEAPTRQFLSSMLEDNENSFDGDADQYGAHYRKLKWDQDYAPHGPDDRWPVIMSGIHEETLQDGWRRFSSYVRAGHSTIPAIFYPERRHYGMLRALNTPKPR